MITAGLARGETDVRQRKTGLPPETRALRIQRETGADIIQPAVLGKSTRAIEQSRAEASPAPGLTCTAFIIPVGYPGLP